VNDVKCICNFKYARYKRGGPVIGDVRGWLKYVQFRDDRNDRVPDANSPDRWVDGGLGVCYQHILARLDELSRGNRHAYCHHIVVSPDPQAMAQIRGDPKDRFVEAVRDILQEWDEWRWEHDSRPQAGPIEYSFVVHRPVRAYGEQMHAHVVLGAATEHHMTRDLTPLYNDREHLVTFKEIAYRQLDLAFGLDREQDGATVGQDPKRGQLLVDSSETWAKPGSSLARLLSDSEGDADAEWIMRVARLLSDADGETGSEPGPVYRLLDTVGEVRS
jgi:hypothetical protein